MSGQTAPVDPAARGRLRERLAQATPGDMQQLGTELLQQYGTYRYAAEALLEAVLDGRPKGGTRPKDAVATMFRTSDEQWGLVDTAMGYGWALTDVLSDAARAVLAQPPHPARAAELTSRYGRGSHYSRGRARGWRPDPTLRDNLAQLAKRLGVTSAVLLRWGLDNRPGPGGRSA